MVYRSFIILLVSVIVAVGLPYETAAKPPVCSPNSVPCPDNRTWINHQAKFYPEA
jgi:hypothetical protein